MIEVMTIDRRTGTPVDRAEADTPEAALFAARTLWDEAHANRVCIYQNFDVSFFVEGKLVRQTRGRP